MLIYSSGEAPTRFAKVRLGTRITRDLIDTRSVKLVLRGGRAIHYQITLNSVRGIVDHTAALSSEHGGNRFLYIAVIGQTYSRRRIIRFFAIWWVEKIPLTLLCTESIKRMGKPTFLNASYKKSISWLRKIWSQRR